MNQTIIGDVDSHGCCFTVCMTMTRSQKLINYWIVYGRPLRRREIVIFKIRYYDFGSMWGRNTNKHWIHLQKNLNQLQVIKHGNPCLCYRR